MGIETKSIAALIDELGTTLIKCWFAQEDVMRGGDDAFVAAAAVQAQKTNARRNQLMRAIDEYFDDPSIALKKSYDKSEAEQSMTIESLNPSPELEKPSIPIMATQVQVEEFFDREIPVDFEHGKAEPEKPEMIEFDPDSLFLDPPPSSFNYAAPNGFSREEMLEAHLRGLAYNVLHPTDSAFTRRLAQTALDYLAAAGNSNG